MTRSIRIFFLFFAFCSQYSWADTILNETDGNNIPFSSLKGRWVFIHYWATWCQVCLDELAELNQFYAMNKEKNISLFAVNYDTPPLDEQKKVIKALNIRFPSLQNSPARSLRLGSIRGVPVTYVFNPEGELCDSLYGPQTIASLQEIMKTCGATKA